MRVADSQLKAFILDSKLVSERDIRVASEEAQKRRKYLGEILIERNLIKEEELVKLEAYILGIPFVNLEKETVDPNTLNIIPEAIAKKNNIVAFKKTGDDLQVAMLDPDDIQTLEFIKKKAGLKILPRLTTQKSIKEVLKQYQKSLQAEFGEIVKEKEMEEALAFVKDEGDEGKSAAVAEDLKKMAEDLPIIKIVDTFIRHAILEEASDIHVEPSEKDLVVRYRVDGILRHAMTLPANLASAVVARIKVMSNLKLDEHRLPQDGRFKIETADYRISFRVSIMPVYDGEKIVMRLLPENSKGFSLETLGFNSQNLDLIHRNITKPTGMILVTGPTGSGKTTSLYTILDMLNKPGVNIVTVEDPIEYRMPGINQTQIRADIGLTFASGLRTILRQDPNVIMVGEIRDNETAALAINAALTGHLVLSTLHTNSASGALPRLLDMKIEPFLIASTVNIIVAQRLVRTLCENKEKYALGENEKKALEKSADLERISRALKLEKVIGPNDSFESVKWSRPKPSADCKDGYRGRVGIHEVLEITESIRDLIMKNSTAAEIDKVAREKNGMINMTEDGFVKAAQGITSMEEVFRVTSE